MTSYVNRQCGNSSSCIPLFYFLRQPRAHQIHFIGGGGEHLVGEAAEVLEDAAQGPGGYESGFHLIGYQQGFPLCICKVLSLRLQNMRFYFQLNFVAQFVLGNFHIVSHLQIEPELRFNTKTFPEA